MTPYHLHATAAAWSLHRALGALTQRARDAAEDAIAGNRGPRDIAIPSQVFGRRTALGGHGDPVADLAISSLTPARTDPNAELLTDITTKLAGMAAHLAEGHPDPLTRIREAIPAMRTSTAARAEQALVHLDRIVRRHLHIGPDLAPMPGNPPCPSCGLQMLQVQTSAPNQADWTVVCGTPCLCTGQSCQCGMPTRIEGVAHIWTAPRQETMTR